MSDDVLTRVITVDMVHTAINIVTFAHPSAVTTPAPVCASKQCRDNGCRFPHYTRDGGPVGLVATVLTQLGLPMDVLKELDREYELGEVLHPGVKIARSRNAALVRIDAKGRALLAFLQEREEQAGRTWIDLAIEAFRPRRRLKLLDVRRRPWLY